jgi:hypothetical protein
VNSECTSRVLESQQVLNRALTIQNVESVIALLCEQFAGHSCIRNQAVSIRSPSDLALLKLALQRLPIVIVFCLLSNTSAPAILTKAVIDKCMISKKAMKHDYVLSGPSAKREDPVEHARDSNRHIVFFRFNRTYP